MCGHSISGQTVLNHMSRLGAHTPRPRTRSSATKPVKPRTVARRKLRAIAQLLAEAQAELPPVEYERFLTEVLILAHDRHDALTGE